MPKAKDGTQIRLSEEQSNQIRKLFLSGKKYEEIIEIIPCRKSNFWNIVKDLKAERDMTRFKSLVSKLEKLPEKDKGWIAGIIDGEGYIGAVYKKNHIYTRVCVNSTTPIMQVRLQELCGGHLYKQSKPSKHKNTRMCQKWQIDCFYDVASFLTVIEPYLVVKKHISEILRKICFKRITQYQKPYDKEDLEGVILMNKYNAKGSDAQNPLFEPRNKTALKAGQLLKLMEPQPILVDVS
jgi:hypothetical protein